MMEMLDRAISRVYPSGLLLATKDIPTAPAAPVLFTTITGLFSTFSMAAATGRAVRSATPPGGNGATRLIGRVGNGSWAQDASGRPRVSAKRTASQRVVMGSPPPGVVSPPGRDVDANPSLG